MKTTMAVLTVGLQMMAAGNMKAQEININSSTNVAIPDGSTEASKFANTYIGDFDVNTESGSWFFEISNIAPNTSLTFGGNATLSGANPGDFSILTQPAGPLNNVNGNYPNCPLQVVFDPTAAGLRTAIVTVTSNDADEGVYTFTVAGTGTTGLQPAPSDTKIVSFGVPKVKYNAKDDLTIIKGKFLVGNGGPSPAEGAVVKIYTVAGLGAPLPQATLLGTPAQTIELKPTVALLDPAKAKEKKVKFKVGVAGAFTQGRVYATISPLPGTLTEDYWLDNINYQDVDTTQ